MDKKKLLVWSDFIVPTGFGQVSKNLLKDAHKDYDVEIVGINYRGDEPYDQDKWFVYATKQLGIDTLKKRAEKTQPDIIFLFQDIFNIKYVLEDLKDICPDAKIVVYFPIDGSPASISWRDVLLIPDKVFVYTEWSKKVLKDTFQFPLDLEKLYHGINPDTFYPKGMDEIKQMKKDQGWSDKFVITNVNRFQPRKQITLTARVYSMFAKGFQLCMDCNHHMPHNRNRCELCRSDNLKSRESNVKDTMLYLHMMPDDQSMGRGGENTLQNHLVNAGFTDRDMNKILAVNGKDIYAGEVSDSDMNDIYNMSDINITTTVGEGAGLSLLESQAVGVPSIAPYNSAIPEMIGDTGWLVDNKAIMTMANDNGLFRPVVDEWEMVKALKDAYKQWKKKDVVTTQDQYCIDRIHDEFLWEDKRQQLYDAFKQVLSTKQ